MSLQDLKRISKTADAYILGNGLTFVLAYSDQKKVKNIKVSSDLANAIMKAATGFKVNLIGEYNKLSIPTNQKLVVNDTPENVEDTVTVIFDMAGVGCPLYLELEFIGPDAAVSLSKEESSAVLAYLNAKGATNDPTADKYIVLNLVNAVPKTAEMLPGTLYVLRNAVDGYPSLTAFLLVEGVRNTMDTVTGETTPAPEPEPEPPGPGPEPPVPEPDPEDASTIPDTEEKEEATGTIGGDDVDEVQVWNNAITDRLNVSAADEVSVVNSTLSDGAVVINIK